ncbi:MAG: hypothetical protein A2498_04290 [Lentisphaerae bacterium RIFOXYC12_FULL_60_16]|nr:MAG: hypothetical protein A2498_04290 [Lentisphaerae bacterium RIFOXYC12_FULL_60_16]OGV71707.1 MAG: hypothetical protein A2269_00385 [Lentisphaerae bacterium RIFOXYA12_FULL_60_10]OGV75130.1 MAG: hypothetical protein A2340_05750 [Lentisphaerae bacterium RIFOXYB12_FULL_60_10]
MPARINRPADPERQAQLAAELQRDREQREQGYRAQALKLLPHVCARCTREFSGKRLRELTVHHRDHNYKNNPPDGSNWELLCLYCHDHEHEKFKMKGFSAGPGETEPPPSIFNPFDSLKLPDPPSKPSGS